VTDFYDEMAGVATELLTEFKQGSVVLRRTTQAAGDNPWEPGTETTVDYPLSATVRRVQQKYIDGTLIVGTEDQITFAVVNGIAPSMTTDRFVVDGHARVLKDLRPLPAAGTPVAYIAFVEA